MDDIRTAMGLLNMSDAAHYLGIPEAEGSLTNRTQPPAGGSSDHTTFPLSAQ